MQTAWDGKPHENMANTLARDVAKSLGANDPDWWANSFDAASVGLAWVAPAVQPRPEFPELGPKSVKPPAKAPSNLRPGSISGNPANRLLETGTPLKNSVGWVKRWYRISAEDAQAYANACAEKLDQLYQETRWMPEAARRPYRLQEMSKFRSQWLKEFVENRTY